MKKISLLNAFLTLDLTSKSSHHETQASDVMEKIWCTSD